MTMRIESLVIVKNYIFPLEIVIRADISKYMKKRQLLPPHTF